jgi:hypothetical protein
MNCLPAQVTAICQSFNISTLSLTATTHSEPNLIPLPNKTAIEELMKCQIVHITQWKKIKHSTKHREHKTIPNAAGFITCIS